MWKVTQPTSFCKKLNFKFSPAFIARQTPKTVHPLLIKQIHFGVLAELILHRRHLQKEHSLLF
jgi:hypothetical protein